MHKPRQGREYVMMDLVDESVVIEEEEGLDYYGEALLFRVSVSEHDAPAVGIRTFQVGIPIEQASLIQPIGEDINLDWSNGVDMFVLTNTKFRKPNPALREKLEREIKAAADRNGGLFAAAYGTMKVELIERGSLPSPPEGWWDNEEREQQESSDEAHDL